MPIKSGRGTRTEDTAALGREARCVSRERWRLIDLTEFLPGSTTQSAYRESLIASILDKPFLIYGAEVCSRCGEVKTFHGWAGAMATHPGGGAFICHDCRSTPEAQRPPESRRCEVCRSSPDPSAYASRGKYLCRDCAPLLRRAGGGQLIDALLGRLSRRRNLERRATHSLEVLELNSEIDSLRERDTRARELERSRRLEAEASARLADRHAGRFPGT